jgi:hypothetical protein
MALNIDTSNVNRDTRYSVQDFSYPNDLFADQRYGGNYVVFYINANAESKLVREAQQNGSTFIEGVERIRSEFIEAAEERGLTTTGLGTQAALGVGGGAVLASFLGVGGGATGAGALVAGAGTTATASMASTATREQKRLSTAIALHVPNQLQVRYSTQWTEDDTFALSAIGEVGGQTWDALKNFINDGEGASGDGSDIMNELGAIGSNMALRNGPFAGALSSATGQAANPKKEQVFKGINFRDFTFDYQFFPRNQAEARNVQSIIHQFKYHMHPEFKEGTTFLYLYPSEFDIQYFMNGVENPNIHRHASCVLTDMNINYTPNGVYTTFPDGQPTQINVTLSFRELALVTKEKIGMNWGESL